MSKFAETHAVELPSYTAAGLKILPSVTASRRRNIYSFDGTRHDGKPWYTAYIAKSAGAMGRANAEWSEDPAAFAVRKIHGMHVRAATKRLKSARIAHQIAAKVHADARIWKIGAATEDDRFWELATRLKLDDAVCEVAAAEAEVRRLELRKP